MTSRRSSRFSALRTVPMSVMMPVKMVLPPYPRTRS
ncbi:hypothetical protein FHS50_001896 [Sphingomicrobium lutaoense]|uniref:Uncharacterized protein n=1 Tax=Sphingomicrobium lutaoense TaxID=515949 RepID=A0A839Z7J8_9SPHN|nr:hypothetical protein [Sphingomicrobium lutaoense]